MRLDHTNRVEVEPGEMTVDDVVGVADLTMSDEEGGSCFFHGSASYRLPRVSEHCAGPVRCECKSMEAPFDDLGILR